MLCSKRCSHGGVCERHSGHEGDHSTGNCIYTDAEALTDEAGDDVYMATTEQPAPVAALIVALTAPSQ